MEPVALNGLAEWMDTAAEHFGGEILLPDDLDRIPVGS